LTEKILWKNFLKYFSLERLLLSFKIFSTFGNIVFQENIGLVIFGKIPHGLKPCDLKKGIILSHRIYFLIAQAFLFFEKILC